MESALAIHLNKFGKEHEYVTVGRARLADLELGRGLRAREAGRLAEARDILAAELDLRSVHIRRGEPAVGGRGERPCRDACPRR